MRFSWIKKTYIDVPAEVMKMKRPHRVPISRQLRTILERRQMFADTDFVFLSRTRDTKAIRIDTLEKFLRDHGFRDILVPHGFRSIGRTWMREAGIAHDVAELCLAHAVGTETERAYNRTDLIKERLPAMQAWADYVESCIKAKPIKGPGKFFTFA